MYNIERLKGYFKNGSERTVKAKKNVLYMIVYKGISIFASLLLVPMTINYVDSENYGIWLTLSSMIGWMSFFDIGINNGLRNRLTEALAHKDYVLGRKYVSTTYAILSLIFIPLMALFLLAVPFVPWQSLLNLSPKFGNSLIVAICILVVYFCLNFILSTINIVIVADQQPADASLRSLIQQLVSLTVIYILTLTTSGSLVNLCLALCASPLLVVVFFNLTLFRGKYARLAPSLKFVDFHVAPNLMKLGVQFFIIQLAGVVQWQMANFLIMRYFGAVSVTEYNIAYKYFSILSMAWGILTVPVWTAVTDAIAKDDYLWIKNTVKEFLRIFALFCGVGILMLLVSPLVYKYWIGNKVDIAFLLSVAVLVYNVVMMYGGIFVTVLNGCGQLKVQMYACLVSPFVYIGCFFLCTNIFNWGIYSIIVAAIIANFNGTILAPIQCWKMIKSKLAH